MPLCEWSASEARALPSVSWCQFKSDAFTQGTPVTECSEAKEQEQPDNETHWYFMICQCKSQNTAVQGGLDPATQISSTLNFIVQCA